jgi:hypothetical protein
VDPAAADERERAFVIYAVPAHPRWLGRRVLVVDQGRLLEDGTRAHAVYVTENELDETSGAGSYSVEHLPRAEAAYPAGSAASREPLDPEGTEHTGTDGRVWRRLD